MDELFFLPTTPVAMPRAYWLDRFFLSSLLVVIEPSEDSWQRVQDAMEHHEGNDYDMEILNKVFGNSALALLPRRYALLTRTFGQQANEREAYLGSPTNSWNAREVIEEAKFVHFSDWPLPKPWLKATEKQISEQQPQCRSTSEGKPDCTDREVWLELRKDFSERRLVCYDVTSYCMILTAYSAFAVNLMTVWFWTPILVQRGLRCCRCLGYRSCQLDRLP